MKVAIVLCALVAAVLAAPLAPNPDDFRDEFDRLIVIEINNKLAEIEHNLVVLTHQLAEFEKSKSKELKEQILREVDLALNVMTGVKTHLEHELKRTDLNFLEKFNLDEITATLNVLTKELTEVQKHVKAVESDEVAIPNPDEFRNEFDRLLIIMTEEQFAKLEQALAHLSHQVTELEKSKSKELKAQILREISIGLDFIDSAKGHFERELKRADLNLVEKFNFESALSTGAVLHKDLTALATKVKAIETK